MTGIFHLPFYFYFKNMSTECSIPDKELDKDYLYKVGHKIQLIEENIKSNEL